MAIAPIGGCTQSHSLVCTHDAKFGQTCRTRVVNNCLSILRQVNITVNRLGYPYPLFWQITGALGKVVLIALVLPLLPAVFLGYPLPLTLGLIGSGFLLEYGAAPFGIALGMNPFFVGWVLVCTEIGIFFGLFDILDSFGHTWPPAANFLEKTRQTVHRSKLIEKYGIIGLIPCEILIGVYANVSISWVVGWNKYRSLAFTLIGYIPSLVLTILTTVGLVGAFFPGSLHL